MLTGEILQKVFEVLRETPGYFVFRGTRGEEYVLARKEDFVSGNGSPNSDRQLPLPTASSLAAAVRETAERLDRTPEFVLHSINREIADYHEEEREREIDDLSLSFDKTPPSARASGGRQDKGKRIRFEPIHGDLPPELQD